MKCDPPTRHQTCLNDKEHDPCRKDGAMHRDEQIGNVSVINSGKVEGAGESQEDSSETEDCHRQEKLIVDAPRRRRWGGTLVRNRRNSVTVCCLGNRAHRGLPYHRESRRRFSPRMAELAAVGLGVFKTVLNFFSVISQGD